jgi:hypothetical protein
MEMVVIVLNVQIPWPNAFTVNQQQTVHSALKDLVLINRVNAYYVEIWCLTASTVLIILFAPSASQDTI